MKNVRKIDQFNLNSNLTVAVYWLCLVRKDWREDLLKRGARSWAKELRIPPEVLRRVRKNLEVNAPLFEKLRLTILADTNAGHSREDQRLEWSPCPRPPCPGAPCPYPLFWRMIADVCLAFALGPGTIR